MYQILTAKEIEAMRKEHGEKVEKVLEAGKDYGCKIAIVEKQNSDSSLEWQASKALSPLSFEESIRIIEVMELSEDKILVCFWQGETMHSKRERAALAAKRGKN